MQHLFPLIGRLKYNMKHAIFLIFAFFLVVVSAQARDVERPQPEIATDIKDIVSSATSKRVMAVTAHPLATYAARNILKDGGSAADAAIAAQLVLGLVEPQSSGLGGGAFALYRTAEGDLKSYDARETAPYEITPELFLRRNGKPIGFYDGAIGGRSVGTPGTPALLKTLHEKHGKLEWKDLFLPAIRLARRGFDISPRLAKMADEAFEDLGGPENTLDYFFPYGNNGNNIQAGETLKNKDYKKTLERLRDEGIESFYQGQLGRDIVRAVRTAKNPGYLNLKDLADYKVIEREPVCGGYRGHRICSMGEPSSGGLTVLQILAMLERFDMSQGPTSRNIHLITEASRLAFADRNYYMADPDHVETPGIKLIDTWYLQERAQFIESDTRLAEVSHGTPPEWRDKRGEGQTPDNPGTSHISIIDEDGNMISMTTTIETAFGSRIMTNGFLLNNELTDFSFIPEDENGNPIANAPAPGKRPRSSMAPTIIYTPEGKPYLLIGSAGGSYIIGYVVSRIIALLDWDYSLEDALGMPNFIGTDKAVYLEEDLKKLRGSLTRLGHRVEITDLNSGLTAIEITEDGIKGAADPRREGKAKGL
jgi:gamma-glutamyltranspeptidase/glutathione hydrolase